MNYSDQENRISIILLDISISIIVEYIYLLNLKMFLMYYSNRELYKASIKILYHYLQQFE